MTAERMDGEKRYAGECAPELALLNIIFWDFVFKTGYLNISGGERGWITPA